MTTLFWSLTSGFSILLFFFLYSLFSKREDFLLDDYTEEDAPDNVRFVDKEIYVEDTSKINQMSKEIQLKDEKINELTDIETKYIDVDNENKSLRKKLTESQESLEETKSEIENLRNDKDNLSAQLDKTKKENRENEYKIQDLTDKKYSLETDLKNTKEKNNEYDLELENLKKIHTEDSIKLNSYKQSYQKTKDELDISYQKQKKLEQTNEELKSQIDNLNTKVSKTGKDNTKYNELLIKKNNKLKQNQIQITNLERQKTQQEETINKLQQYESNFEELQEQTNELLTEKNRFESLVYEKVEEISDLEEKVELREKEIVALEEKQEDLESKLEKKSEDLNRAINDRDHFINLLDETDKNLKESKKIIETFQVNKKGGRDKYGKYKSVLNREGLPEDISSQIIDINKSTPLDEFSSLTINKDKTQSKEKMKLYKLDKFIRNKKLEYNKNSPLEYLFIIFNNKYYDITTDVKAQ